MSCIERVTTLVAGRRLRRFGRDVRGVAAVEFAFILPVLVVLLLGTVEVLRAIDADRKLGNATSAIADLIAREQELTDADLEGVAAAVQHFMAPYEPDGFRFGIIAVRVPMTPGDPPVVEWSYSPTAHQKPVPARCAPYTDMTDGLVSPGGRAIIVESTYDFTPMFGNWSGKAKIGDGPFADATTTGIVRWEDKATFTPRADCVHNTSQQNSSSRCDFSCN